MVLSRVVGISLLLTSFYLSDAFSQISEDIEVTIADGRILGKQLKTEKNNSYYAFQDIPYAQPPIGALRFQEPIPVEKWKGVLNTTSNSKICIQFGEPDEPRETEDCLVLNVYTPMNPQKIKKSDLPVMVWIHGGSFQRWYGAIDSYGPDYFIDKDLIVVTLNYRLGPLGFLTTGDGVIPANNGLKDQNLALRWVNKNIEMFGGDPSKVTIAGQSAGAASVGYHLLSKKSAGLFRAAIMQSGSPLICWTLQKYPKDMANTYASNLKWDSKLLSTLLGSKKDIPSEMILEKLQNTSVADLKKFSDITLQILPSKKNCHYFTSLVWTPVYEEEGYENAFVTGMSHENLKNGNFNKVPVLMGINSEESLLFGAKQIQLQCTLFDLSMRSLIPKNLLMEENNKVPASHLIKELYTKAPFLNDESASVNLASDLLFVTPTARHAYLQSKYTDVYFYQFSYLGQLGRLVNTTVPGAEGVAHQEEVEYFFRSGNNQDLSKFPEKDRNIHDQMIDLWSQFIKDLNPTYEKKELLQNIVWPKVTPQDFFYLNINSTLKISRGPKRYYFYSEIYSKYAKPLLDTY